ncbi:MAG: hypothetical protein ICV68_06370 [Pyrinomonadaceae bacterium]|nr:hypothetical protein [Pyrinomonadaceae bacterium]
MPSETEIQPRFSAIDRALLFIEDKCTLFGASLLLAVLLMIVAMLYVRPAFVPSYHGIYYAQLAAHPFQAANPNAYRLLTPLIAYLTGLRGDKIIILNLLVALALLAVVYYHSRRASYAPSLALAVAAMLAFTMPTLFTIYYGGYTDSTTYLLILLMLTCAKRPVLFWLLFLLALLNRESVIFLLPFFALWHWYRLNSQKIFLRSILIGPAATVALYLLFRALINSQTVVLHTGAFYFEPLLKDPLYWLRQTIQAYPLGFFSAFKLFWALPVAAAFFALRERSYLMAALILSPIIFSAAQSFIALDTSRLLAMAFPSLLMSIIVLREKMNERQLAKFMLFLVLFNFALPQMYVTSNEVSLMYSAASLLSGGTTVVP